MTWQSVVIGFGSLTILVAFWLWAARRAYHVLTDRDRDRLLLLASVTNVLLTCILALLLGALWITTSMATRSLTVGQGTVILFMFGLPARMAWNYFYAPRKVGRLWSVQRVPPSSVPAWIKDLSAYFETVRPQFAISRLASAPFVFGRQSGHPTVVVPEYWRDKRSGPRTAAIVHELAHAFNGDVGFTTWAFAFLRGAWW